MMCPIFCPLSFTEANLQSGKPLVLPLIPRPKQILVEIQNFGPVFCMAA